MLLGKAFSMQIAQLVINLMLNLLDQLLEGYKHPRNGFTKWVNNSSALIKSGDAAVKLFEENNKAVMTAFLQLSTTDIDNIMAYTSEPKPEPTKAAAVGTTTCCKDEGGISNNVILCSSQFGFVHVDCYVVFVNNVLTK